MSAIGPGDFVEYVGKTAGYINPSSASTILESGAVYLVTEVGRRCVDGAGQVWNSIRIKGGRVVNEFGRPVSYPVEAFLPLYRPKPDAFTDLLKIPDKAKEPA